MKKILLYTTSIFFILGTSFAREVVVSPVIVSHKTIIERRVVQLNQKLGVECTTSTTTVLNDGLSWFGYKRPTSPAFSPPPKPKPTPRTIRTYDLHGQLDGAGVRRGEKACIFRAEHVFRRVCL